MTNKEKQIQIPKSFLTNVYELLMTLKQCDLDEDSINLAEKIKTQIYTKLDIRREEVETECINCLPDCCIRKIEREDLCFTCELNNKDCLRRIYGCVSDTDYIFLDDCGADTEAYQDYLDKIAELYDDYD